MNTKRRKLIKYFAPITFYAENPKLPRILLVSCAMPLCRLIREGRSLLNCDDSDVAVHLQLHTECTHSGADNARVSFAKGLSYLKGTLTFVSKFLKEFLCVGWKNHIQLTFCHNNLPNYQISRPLRLNKSVGEKKEVKIQGMVLGNFLTSWVIPH